MNRPRRVILDAGPALTFCAANKQQILYGTLSRVGDLLAPERVDIEVLDKARSRRFTAARKNWLGLVEHGHVALLSDEQSDALDAAVVAISQTPFAERVRQTRDLGELMVMAHALVLRDQGLDVVVLIDEWRGQQLASRQSLRVMDTQSVLRSAARNGFVADRGQMRKVYAELRKYDDGLVDITQTDLLAKAVWTPRP